MAEELPILVIGGGPAGLTAAYQLSKADRSVIVCEADPDYVGGISRTVEYDGYRFDIGGHRFFSKSAEIEALWDEMLDEEMLVRNRSSRIFYRNKYFTYPLKPIEAFLKLGPAESLRCVLSYVKAKLFPYQDPKNFEQWVSNKFGKRLYSIFFKTYTEKVWGMSCSEISADWAAQRIQGLSLSSAVLSAFKQKPASGKIEKTLINTFRYPRKGPGMLWEQCAEKIIGKGGEIRMGRKVVGLEKTQDGWQATMIDRNGREQKLFCSHVISSAPLSKLVAMLSPVVPDTVLKSAQMLNYRDFVTVAVIVDGAEQDADQWIYIHDPNVQVGRVQNYRAWSPEMVPNETTSCFGLEYFCFETNTGLWAMSDERLEQLAKDEIVQLGLVDREQILDATVVRQQKAYPVYDDEYSDHLDVIRQELAENYPTIYPIGRNGMHQYNNQDHSMMTALLCVENILAGTRLYDVWQVNEDAVYTESGRDSSVSGLRHVPMPVRKS